MSATSNTIIQHRLLSAMILTLLIGLPSGVFGQSSPLTVQPSTGRVGVGNTNPQHPLDVTGAIRATGNVTANGFIGDGSQLTNLPASSGSTALNKVTANTTVVSTAAETNLYSFSVAGGTLGTNNMLRLTIQVTDLDMNDGDNCVLRFKYGSTTLASLTISNNTQSFVSNSKALVSVIIAGDGATNTQVGSIVFHGSHAAFVGPFLAQGTSAVDSTTAQTFSVTADWSSSSSTNSITLGQAILEKIS